MIVKIVSDFSVVYEPGWISEKRPLSRPGEKWAQLSLLRTFTRGRSGLGHISKSGELNTLLEIKGENF